MKIGRTNETLRRWVRQSERDSGERAGLTTDAKTLLKVKKPDALVTRVEACEAKHYPLDLPDPVEAIEFEMERKDLEPTTGKSNRVYEILDHKRSLTLEMIWKLQKGFGIPAESLIKPPHACV